MNEISYYCDNFYNLYCQLLILFNYSNFLLSKFFGKKSQIFKILRFFFRNFQNL